MHGQLEIAKFHFVAPPDKIIGIWEWSIIHRKYFSNYIVIDSVRYELLDHEHFAWV